MGRGGRGEEQGVYTCSREVHGQHALARVDVYVRDVDTSTPVCVPATYLGRGASFFFLLATTNVPDLSSLAPGMRTRRSEIRKSREGSSRIRDVNSKFVPVNPVDATGSGIFGAFATSGGRKLTRRGIRNRFKEYLFLFSVYDTKYASAFIFVLYKICNLLYLKRTLCANFRFFIVVAFMRKLYRIIFKCRICT